MASACKCLDMDCPIFTSSDMRVSLLEHFAFSSDDELYEVCRVTGVSLDALHRQRSRAWNFCIENDGKPLSAPPVQAAML